MLSRCVSFIPTQEVYALNKAIVWYKHSEGEKSSAVDMKIKVSFPGICINARSDFGIGYNLVRWIRTRTGGHNVFRN